MRTSSFRRHARSCAAAVLVAVAGISMVSVSFDADAARMGGGRSFGRQSPNVTRQATPPATPAPSTPAKPAASATPAAPAAGAAAGAAAARSGPSRWLGPIAGIAAGLGLAALLSHLGLSAAFANFFAGILLIALVAFAVLFIVRRLRGMAARPAMQGSYSPSSSNSAWRESIPQQPARPGMASTRTTDIPTVGAAAPAAIGSAGAAGIPQGQGNWFIPPDFDTPRFLQQAKEYFIRIQGLWDSGDVEHLREYLTDDMVAELRPQLQARQGSDRTEVVLLHAEMLGIEAVSDGHLASVRFSGMLREGAASESFKFEEVWNLFKGQQGGWLLAGIQQIEVDQAG